MNSVCIIALDALEYDLVNEFSLNSLTQKEYGAIDVTNFQHLATPIIWTSFISGLPPEKHNLRLRREKSLLKFFHLIPSEIRKPISTHILKRLYNVKRIKHARGAFRKEQTYVYKNIRQQFKGRNFPILFDINDSIAISVPPYQKWISDKTLRLNKEVIEREIPFVIFQEYVYSVFRRKKRKLLNVIKNDDWTLVMAHFMFTDLLAHHQIRNQKKMLEIYLEAEKLLKEVKSVLPKEIMLLVISDHGMEYRKDLKFGDHTAHGFYSCNQKLHLKNPHITQFYSLILDYIANGETESMYAKY